MKKLYIISLMVIALLLVSCGSSDEVESKEEAMEKEVMEASGPTVLAVPSTGVASVGDDVLVDVLVEGAENVYAIQLDVTYDSDVLEFKKVDEGTFLNQGSNTFSLPPKDDGSTVRNIGLTKMGAVPGADGDGMLVTLTFTAKAAGTGNIGFGKVMLVDPDSEVTNPGTKGGKVEVS